MIFKNFVDTHTHTINSFDGNYPIEDMCDAAIEKGINNITHYGIIEVPVLPSTIIKI